MSDTESNDKSVQMNTVQEQAAGLADLEHAVSNPPVWLSDALSVPREEGFVNVAGCSLHYFRWGDKSKPGIIMLHGFLAHARCFAFIAPYLAADYHVVAYDISGMGDSESHTAYTDELRVDELIGVTQKTGLFDHECKPTIIAHSYGGHIGVAAVEKHADKFAGIIICDLMILRPSYLAQNAEKFKPPGSLNANKPNRVYPDYETAKKRFVLSPPQAVGEPVLFDFMAYHSLKQVEGGWTWKFNPSVFNREANTQDKFVQAGERVVKISGRKAIIYGDESVLFNADSEDYLDELVEEFDEAKFPIIGIPYAGHHLMLDQPIAFVSTLKTILATWK